MPYLNGTLGVDPTSEKFGAVGFDARAAKDDPDDLLDVHNSYHSPDSKANPNVGLVIADRGEYVTPPPK